MSASWSYSEFKSAVVYRSECADVAPIGWRKAPISGNVRAIVPLVTHELTSSGRSDCTAQWQQSNNHNSPGVCLESFFKLSPVIQSQLESVSLLPGQADYHNNVRGNCGYLYPRWLYVKSYTKRNVGDNRGCCCLVSLEAAELCCTINTCIYGAYVVYIC